MNIPLFSTLDNASIYLIMPFTVIAGFVLAVQWLRYARVWLPWNKAAREGVITHPVSRTRWFISAHVLLAIVLIIPNLRTALNRFLFQSVPDGTIPTNALYTALAGDVVFFLVYGNVLAALIFCCITTWRMVNAMRNVLAQRGKAV